MKKLVLLVAVFVATFALTACSTEELDNQILDLEGQVADLEADLDELAPAGDYTPGMYVGMDEAKEYFVFVFINERGGIQNVVFDSTRAQDLDDDGEKESYTKQILGDLYGMRTAEGLNWAQMVQILSDAIVANQGWDENWKTWEGERHDYFDLPEVDDPDTADVDESRVGDQTTIDAVGGVTAGMEGFLAAWQNAIAQAE